MFTVRAGSIRVAQEKSSHATAAGTHHTRQGVHLSLHHDNISNVLNKLIVELKDPKSNYNKVEPKDLLVIIVANVEP